MNFVQPTIFAHSFTCPHCAAIAKQDWWGRNWNNTYFANEPENTPLRIACCQHCNQCSIWVYEQMVYPDVTSAPFPNPQMPENVKRLYQEAASIHTKSPRGAGALLRLGLQVLCKELGESGTNINTDIGNLVKKGLPLMVQQALDVVRVVGNDAVHPGQIDTDDPEIVMSLFQLINVIVEYMIALPNHVSGLYSQLPVEKVKGIVDRDKS